MPVIFNGCTPLFLCPPLLKYPTLFIAHGSFIPHPFIIRTLLYISIYPCLYISLYCGLYTALNNYIHIHYLFLSDTFIYSSYQHLTDRFIYYLCLYSYSSQCFIFHYGTRNYYMIIIYFNKVKSLI